MTVRIRNFLRFVTAFLLFTIFFTLIMDKVVMPLYVAHGKEDNLIDVRNILYSEARSLLERSGYRVVVIDSVRNLNVAPGTVIDQQPAQGQKVKKGRVISLVVSQGEEFFPMPNYKGKVFTAAKLDMDRRGLVLDTTINEYNRTIPEGVVSRQSVEPGETVATNELITLYISLGPPELKLEVPELFGLSLDEAKNKIRKNGFKVGAVREIENSDLAPGTVIGQSPDVGELFKEAREIDLTVTTTNFEE